MKRIALNMTLAVVWCLLTGSGAAWNFVAGLLVGAVVVSMAGKATGQGPYFRTMLGFVRFGWYFLVILTKANVQIAREVITPGFTMTPRTVRYPVGDLTDVQRTVLANAITLTPGTLVIDVSPDDEWMYVHCMYARDRASAIAEIDELAGRLHQWVFSAAHSSSR